MRNIGRPFLLSLLVCAAFLAPATTAYALWSATATGTVNVTVASPAPVVPPLAPVLTCSNPAFNGNNVTIQWQPIGGAEGYKLYVRNASGTFVEFTPTSFPSATSATFNEPTVGVAPYRVVVRSFVGATQSSPSNALSITFGNATQRTCGAAL